MEERATLREEQEAQREDQVLLIHSQVRRIKREDEETRQAGAGGFRGRQAASPAASRSLSPLRRAGNAILVGDWV